MADHAENVASEDLLKTAMALMVPRKSARLQAKCKASDNQIPLNVVEGPFLFDERFLYDPNEESARGAFARKRLDALDHSDTVAVSFDDDQFDRHMRLEDALRQDDGLGRLVVTRVGEEILAWDEDGHLQLVTNEGP